jgi:exopolyphosphatase/guanosine-5'-triphosphate,3'-diphosphate pyrophosphatase
MKTIQDKMQKISVIDLGSNSVKLVNFNITPDNSYQAYQHEAVTVKLGEGLAETNNLKDEPIRRTIDALKLFRDIIDVQSIKHVLTVATSAVREAANREEFLDRVYFETGFKFRVLSEEEEALYSYAGAIRSLRLPTVLFFDIGGGSLEIVCANQFKIKKIVSLPLGTLRLMQTFGDDGELSDRDLAKMKSKIFDLIPSRKELQIPDDATLVGVGGTLRSMAKYHQDMINYPLGKIHNYKISAKSIHSISTRLVHLKPEKIAKIRSISNNRAETIAAGSCVIDILMEKLGFDEITVSAQGLREGTLSLSLEYPKEFSIGKVEQTHIQNSMRYAYESDIIPQHLEDVVRFLVSEDLISENERQILAHSLRQAPHSITFQNIMNFFSFGMDSDSKLDHHDQLISVLSVIYSKKKKKLDKIFDKFDSILIQPDKKAIRKISSILLLSELLAKSDAKIKLRHLNDDLIKMKIHPVKNKFPEMLFEDVIDKVSDAFNVDISYSIVYNSKYSTQSIEV